MSTKGIIDGLCCVGKRYVSQSLGFKDVLVDEPSVCTLERKGRLGELLHKFGTLRNRK